MFRFAHRSLTAHLVARMRAAMTEVVDGIRGVSDTVGEMTSATKLYPTMPGRSSDSAPADVAREHPALAPA